MPVIEVGGIKTYFTCHLTDSNDAEPVILVHGAGGDHTTWPAALRRLDGAFVYALDLPGHGKSDGNAFDSIEAYAGFVKSFIQAAGISKASFIGHSMGAAVLLALASEAPDLMESMVLTGAGVRFRVLPAFLEGLRTTPDKVLDRINSYAYGREVSEEMVAAGRRRLKTVSPETMLNDLTACDKFDISEKIGEIQVRTLILSGDQDLLTPSKFGEFLCHQIKKSKFRIIKDAGHMAHLEQPDIFTDFISQFLKLGKGK